VPFSLSPDPAFYFASEKHQEGLASLFYVIHERKGFALVTGEVGAGKTLLCRAALKQLGPEVQSAYITTTALSAPELVQAICGEFDIPNRGRGKWEMLEDFGAFVAQQAAKGGNVVIIIDEAQNLPLEALEEVRMLSNFESDAEKFVQVLLVGQPELRKRAKQPEMQQLMQRFAVKFHLNPLDRQETARYIHHRLNLAGGNCAGDDLFTPETIDGIFVYSRGVPRLINLLCDKALLTCYVEDCRTVTPAIVDDVIKELNAYHAGVELTTPSEPLVAGAYVGQPFQRPVAAPRASEPGRYGPREGPRRERGKRTSMGQSAGDDLVALSETVSRGHARPTLPTDGVSHLGLAGTDGSDTNGRRTKTHLALGRWPGARRLVWVACDTWGGWPQERATFWAGEVTCRLCRRTRAFKAAARKEAAECPSARD